MAARPSQVKVLRPEDIYPLADFRWLSGISETRMRLARRDGIVLRTLKVGKRRYVRGFDAIEYLVALDESEGAETRPGRGDPSPN